MSASKPHSVQDEFASVREAMSRYNGRGSYEERRFWFEEGTMALARIEEQLESALATIETLQDKDALSALIRAQTEEIERLEEQLEAAQEELRENDRLVERAWQERDDETEKAKRAEEQLEAARHENALIKNASELCQQIDRRDQVIRELNEQLEAQDRLLMRAAELLHNSTPPRDAGWHDRFDLWLADNRSHPASVSETPCTETERP